MARKREVKVAVIDMNNGIPNLGLKSILNTLSLFKEAHKLDLFYDVFDLRLRNEIPGTGYDVYISSGGPGSPYEGKDSSWEFSFFNLLDDLEIYNTKHQDKKHVFLICYSFQLACRKYGVGTVTERKSDTFGIFPVTLTAEGESDLIYAGLPNPFYAVDSRNWQVIDTAAATLNAKILALEKERPHIELERCVMSVRFSDEFVGTQFHPEADPAGMKLYLLNKKNKASVIAAHGEEKYRDLLHDLEDPDKIMMTWRQILPNFLNQVIQSIKEI